MDKKLTALLEAREHDPFALLGLHPHGRGWRLRVLRPHASHVQMEIDGRLEPMERQGASDLFEWRGDVRPEFYWLRIGEAGRELRLRDPYAFPPRPSEHDLFLFSEGNNSQAYRLLGAVPETRDGIGGVCFRTWAPNAARVSVVGDFNRWDGRTHPMASLGASGCWELFIPDLPTGSLYKFEIRNRASGAVMAKADPYARQFEKRPATAARVTASRHAWQDRDWMAARTQWDWLHSPMSIYEAHPGSWMRHPDGRFYSYRELAERLVPYLADMGYTHLELMPVMEHPLDESWGYQCTGFFAPSARFGDPDDFRFLVDACHQSGIGVILDWVPGHFPRDEWALAHYDGSALYEHEDPAQKIHPDWGTYVFNYGRNEVRSFLMSSAHYWLSEFHVDGLRVDAVASMIYLDYSRKAGEWRPNRHGGRENLEAIGFLRAMNEMVHREFPGALTIAEESTAWPMVSRPVYLGGLGFSMKWNMGWMNDTLDYMTKDPIYRRYHHDCLTFGQLYAYTENFVLPLSHDEVVHGKGSLLGKMPGDGWQRFANLRLLLTYQMTSPGKKLTFMGNELGQPWEWSEAGELPWSLLQYPAHGGVQRLARDLNRLHRELPPFHELDFDSQGFSWIDCHDGDQSVIAWLRLGRDGSHAVVALNFTPVPRPNYRIGVPAPGAYREILNSDSRHYGGSDMGNSGALCAEAHPWMGRPASLVLTLPPLAGVVLVPLRS
ncbi:1,4-alpha-glucan branching protein GlgB [Denitratisoma oestradiolicum]|uniref:1,4-alpha-glucan branching enzyme GlgB n=1 Tax=Denitratisoma oestradiolicum TaxID=311182 RepID=A0A6S6Y1L0_9PROT|nr:1,4-alpha-glucan branching protein GlgB [Denitratisoma oestradiolicum]TWO81772.1 1,4-alpha-glucan branching enzyme [Denitratisoma oestradiolicum]CAB1370731.1 1,4-alpha-glucan branching enzyme [Denitratisoma oestradiolicum]